MLPNSRVSGGSRVYSTKIEKHTQVKEVSNSLGYLLSNQPFVREFMQFNIN